MVKLSVVIPHLNYGRYLKECLDSLAAQTFQDYEVVLVDGGSSDNTFQVLKDYPMVKVLHDIPPKGPVKAVNKGISVMKGEYFNQLNSDCRLHPTMYEECLKVLESDKKLGMVYTRWLRINDSNLLFGYAKQPSQFNRDLLLQGNFIDATSMVIRRECFDKVGVFDEQCPWSMDWLMAAKISMLFPVVFLNKALFDYRVHKGQITEVKSIKEFAKAEKIVRSYYGFGSKFKADVTMIARSVARKLLT